MPILVLQRYCDDLKILCSNFWNFDSMPEINISPVADIVSGSRHFVPVTRNMCRSSVYDILLKFENMPVIVTGRKRILSVTHEIVPDSDRWPAVISCTALNVSSSKNMVIYEYQVQPLSLSKTGTYIRYVYVYMP